MRQGDTNGSEQHTLDGFEIAEVLPFKLIYHLIPKSNVKMSLSVHNDIKLMSFDLILIYFL